LLVAVFDVTFHRLIMEYSEGLD